MTNPQPAPESAQQQEKIQRANTLEREAHRLRADGKIDQAFQTFDQAAKLFQEAGEHLKSAVCYASAATCWNIHTGWQPLKNAATRSELAAIQAFEAGDYVYAEALFSDAALLYEKEGNSSKYSYCYERTKDAQLKHLWNVLFRHGRKENGFQPVPAALSFKKKTVLLSECLMGHLSSIIWGHGERPFRTFVFLCGIVFGSALLYYFSGSIVANGVVQKIDFFESLYLSVITYATVGYGDYTPVGWVRTVACCEALTSILLTPLFFVALTRRYLRLSR